ncbi:nuclear transport factor 2 family protein [Lacimicrobium sp. SS2-24]|uniref:nuclear transport factor 2 family protein n=1 Tax=Lacimicrobium sp. SS2-24 TaxID=2005569 RepID=UPI001AEFF087|nr:nuclear transport factor 2 family protein [Lacimicrobium sp. SS2-24]
MNTSGDITRVEVVVQKYFDGLHNGDVELLSTLFASDCALKAPGIRRSKDEWLEMVQSRPIPALRGDQLRSKILSIEIIGDQAMVKAFVPVLDRIYIDYLGLLREDQEWLIVNKMYADYPKGCT